MAIPAFTRSAELRISKAVNWVERQTTDDGTPPVKNTPVNPPAICGYLLQNIYGNGYGLMQLIYRSPVVNTTKLDLIGTNFVFGSTFKLQLWGQLVSNDPNVSNPMQMLYQTGAISVNCTATQMQVGLTLAAQSAALPVGNNDIFVSLGNPTSSPELVLWTNPKLQPEIVQPTQTVPIPASYVGSWCIAVTGPLTGQYNNLGYRVFEDTQAYLKGLSFITSQMSKDFPGTVNRIVTDFHNRPADYPWRAGSICCAILMPNIGGYGIISSDYREQTISLPTSSS